MDLMNKYVMSTLLFFVTHLQLKSKQKNLIQYNVCKLIERGTG